MLGALISIFAPLFVGAGTAGLFLALADRRSLFSRYFAQYLYWWQSRVEFCRVQKGYNKIPMLQLAAVGLVVAVAVVSEPFVLGLLVPVAALPPLLLHRQKNGRLVALENSLDGFFLALADSLTTIPNLAGALESLIPNIDEPVKSEVLASLAEVKLGRTIEDALLGMSRRLNLPGLDAAVGAALLGKRTGGDLPVIMRRIASTQREMLRLEGVVRTKTAEGRSQAWVMGSVPPALILILEWVNPEWLAPLWVDPIGWIMLGGAAVFEVIAIVLIRKIMAVEI